MLTEGPVPEPVATEPPSATSVRALGGSPWSGTDAAEAHRATHGELEGQHWPVLPELPDRGPGADDVGRSAALLRELPVDLQPHGWRVSPPGVVGSGMDRRRAASFWREDAHRWADTAGAEGVSTERLAVRVRGPLSLLGALWLPGGERVLIDAGARRDVAESYREGLIEALGRLRETTGARRLGVVLDEPWAAAVLAGALPTASGYRTVRSMPRDEARHVWRELLTGLMARGGIEDAWLAPGRAGVGSEDGAPDHAALAALAAEALPDAPPPSETGTTRQPVSLVLPVGALEGPGATPEEWGVVAGWADAGRRVTLRTAERPATIVRTWDRMGMDPALLRRVTLTVGGRHDAAVLRRLRTDAEELDARVGELLG